MKEMIAVVMASTGLDAKTAKERLEKALSEMETVAEYAAIVRPPAKPDEVTLVRPPAKPDEVTP